jgi:hypothetical protein
METAGRTGREGKGAARACALLAALLLAAAAPVRAAEPPENPLALPVVGSTTLRILAPTVLELTVITTAAPGGRVAVWDFVRGDGGLDLPASESLAVRVNGRATPVRAVGFKRRVIYAPLRQRDLRVASRLTLLLAEAIPDRGAVEVRDREGRLGPAGVVWQAMAAPLRESPAVHVNQVGYAPDAPKRGIVGYFLGTLGELPLPAPGTFSVVHAGTGAPAYTGQLRPRPDQGFAGPQPYQQVAEADFSPLRTPGTYRLAVAGLGASLPFDIAAGIPGAFARTYALGLYQQRCGTALGPPYTRFAHEACHTAPAAVPTPAAAAVERHLAGMAVSRDEAQTAPPLTRLAAGLFPFQRQGSVDVSGGHHDAGDYSKYTINSALMIHALTFAADAFPGAGALDNLGLPESGDGRGDLVQVAKREADFLLKMQDADGGFYFLVYPRDRRYEQDVLPDRGDPQVVFPKNTAATAAATAALAQAGSSPRFRREFPSAAATYLEAARRGWAFLERAFSAHGRTGAYQRVSHYGDTFQDADEVVWAATEIYLATGSAAAHALLLREFDPADPKTRRWGWERLFEGYGAATRSYAFAARTGRVGPDRLDRGHLARCERELLGAAAEHVATARASAYGTAFPLASKRHRTAGWYFPVAAAFDLAVAHVLEPRPEFLDALLGEISFELGGNPNNVSFLTGLGWRQPREIVHQYAQNDERVLPPSGLPLGSLQAGFAVLPPYGADLAGLSVPRDDLVAAPFPLYDRWADCYNVATEFTVVAQARGLAATSLLMARSPVRTQPWRPPAAAIRGVPPRVAVDGEATAHLAVPGLDVGAARVVWETPGQEPAFGPRLRVRPRAAGPSWIEAEAVWSDGRRVVARLEFEVVVAPRRAKED